MIMCMLRSKSTQEPSKTAFLQISVQFRICYTSLHFFDFFLGECKLNYFIVTALISACLNYKINQEGTQYLVLEEFVRILGSA